MSREKYFSEKQDFLKPHHVKEGQVAMIDVFEEIQTSLGLRPCIRFDGIEQPLNLNTTNYDWLAARFGDKETDWHGKAIAFHIGTAPNPQQGGKIGPALRLTLPKKNTTTKK
jgi:hypothetical protein